MHNPAAVKAVFKCHVVEFGGYGGIDEQYACPPVGICTGPATKMDRVSSIAPCQHASLDDEVLFALDEDFAARFNGECSVTGNGHVGINNPGRVRPCQGQVVFDECGYPATAFGGRCLAGRLLVAV